jgi:hypothetical protein
MIYRLYIRKRSKNVNNLENRYFMSKRLLEKKSRYLYKIRLRYLKLLLLL